MFRISDSAGAKAEASHYNPRNKGLDAFDPKAGADKRGKPITGTKYSRYGSRKEGLSSALDQGIIDDNMAKKRRNFGQGSYTFQLMGPDGKKALQGGSINIGGRYFEANSQGVFRVVDNDYLEEIEKEYKERESYIISMTKRCCISDEIAMDILGLDPKTFRELCAPDGCKAMLDELNMSSDLDSYNCLPSFLSCLDENTSLFSGGISKLKKIVGGIMPICENMTSDKTEKAGIEK